ncbi:MAG: AMP-binding protein [Nitrospirae bacterium]|nr:AMP-binding protein [Nitrospirota bacterium]
MDTKLAHNITEAFLRAARLYPGNTAFHYFDAAWKTLTYETFSAQVASSASFLMNSGITSGDRAAIISENRPQWCIAYLAVITAGAVAVPVDAQLGPAEIKNLLEDSGAKMIFYSQKTADHVMLSLEMLPEQTRKNLAAVNIDLPEYESVISAKHVADFPKRGPEDVASIIYTSGTTGMPKGVVLTHRNFCSDAEALIEAQVVSHEDNVLSVLPLHHTYAFMCTFLVPVFLGASITYPESLKGPDLMSAIRERGVSIVIGVPQLLGMIRNGIMQKIRNMPRPLSSLLSRVHRLSGLLRQGLGINIGRVIFRSAHAAFGGRFRFLASGGARLDPEIMKDLEALGFTVLEGYGLTETSPVLTFNPFSKRKPGSAGKPLPSVEIRIDDPAGAGEGEILARGPMVMKGYYRNPSATADAIQEGWFRTGDIGRVDRDGYLFITGRSKEVIVLSSGKNIYPEDVEKLYRELPLIKEICVIGLEEGGITEGLHAVIVPDLEYAKKARITNIQESLKWELNRISGSIPSYMRLNGFSLYADPLPRTPLGKLRRFMIKDLIRTPEKAAEKPSGKEAAFSDETVQQVVLILGQFIKVGQRVLPGDNLELDIGLDSLSKIELLVALEKAFSVQLPEDFIADVHTVGELAEKVKALAVTGYQAAVPEKAGWRELLLKSPSEKDLGMVSLGEEEGRTGAAHALYIMLRLFFRLFFRLEAKGAENIPSGRNFILTPNHTSYLDGFAVILSLPFSFFRQIYSLGLSEYFTGFLKGRLAKTAHVIPIDAASYLNKALQMSAYVLRNGRSLSVFPEGGRSFDGILMEFKKGVGILAVEMGVSVVPVYIHGAFEAMRRDSKLPRPGRIRVVFGRPLHASDVDFTKKPAGVDDYQHFANLLRERVKELGEREQGTAKEH